MEEARRRGAPALQVAAVAVEVVHGARRSSHRYVFDIVSFRDSSFRDSPSSRPVVASRGDDARELARAEHKKFRAEDLQSSQTLAEA